MEKSMIHEKKYYDFFIKAAQYIVGITAQQNVYEHLASLMMKFIHAKWVAFAQYDANNNIVLLYCTIENKEAYQHILSTPNRKIMKDVLDSSFMAVETIETTASYKTVFLPLYAGNQTKSLMIVAHKASEKLSNDILNMYLALAGIASTSIERFAYESELRDHRDRLEDLVQARTSELNIKNRQLEEALNHLKLTQAQLIESEKMAALGQLIAGVAHEVNSPLGAIRAAVDNISQTLSQVLDKQFMHFCKNLPHQLDQFFDNLMSRSVSSNNSLSAKEERKYRRSLANLLDTQGISESSQISHYLVMMGIYNDIESLIPLFKIHHSFKVLEMVYKLSGLSRSATIISTAIERATKIVFALKNYAHFDQQNQMIMADVVEGIETVLTLYHNQLKQGIEIQKYYGNVPKIFCYADELNQVWTNLIHNAIHAMNLKGILTIRISSKDHALVIQISDTGKGIPSEICEKIFNPFFTTKAAGEGSGLGLHIVKNIIAKHKGTITFTSEIDKGSCFIVKLPIINEIGGQND